MLSKSRFWETENNLSAELRGDIGITPFARNLGKDSPCLRQRRVLPFFTEGNKISSSSMTFSVA